MKTAWLQLNATRYSFRKLKSGHFQNHTNPFERATLEFCHHWLNGKKTFVSATSGSTGKPKKIVLKRSQLTVSARNTIRALKLKRGDTSLLCLDPRYIAGKMMLVRSLLAGMNIVAVIPSADPFSGLDDNIKIDFTALVPYQLQAILSSAQSRRKLNRLKAVLIGGAETDPQTQKKITRLKPAVYSTYGMTETISHIALQKLNPPGAKNYFTVLPDIRIDQDKRGCLAIRATYLGRRPIVTNDLVDILSPQKFRWRGRWDNVINTGGVKVIPEKIEKVVAAIFAKQKIRNRFFVTGLPDVRLGNTVALIVEGQLSSSQIKKSIEKLDTGLARFEMPRVVLAIPHFVETDTQKINRRLTLRSL
jgi:O-succinylbenzoic acid--CoA ligase